MPASGDTIFAAASGHGRAAICVVRISGSGSGSVLTRLTRRPPPPPRRAVLRRLWAPDADEVLDEALVLWLPGPATFTGEDQAELHIHGGLAVRSGVLAALGALPGCRLAEPGEFTRRAFLNARLDLTEAEGLADLIDAETEAQRRQALRQLGGALGDAVARWREQLVDAAALLAAALDFSDEDDVHPSVAQAVSGTCLSVATEMTQALAGAARGERLRDGVRVVIAGAPNAGKSTLLNALARRDVAITSDMPGTTRDAIEVRCDLDGLPVLFVDTAGLRPTQDRIEEAGIAIARRHMAEADLILWLAEPGSPTNEADLRVSGPVWRILSKDDDGRLASPGMRSISAETGHGMASLLDDLHAHLSAGMSCGDDAIVTRERHRIALGEAAAALHRASAISPGREEVVAEEMRVATQALGRIAGRIEVEDLLDRIFSQFCIGK